MPENQRSNDGGRASEDHALTPRRTEPELPRALCKEISQFARKLKRDHRALFSDN
jgi:hypothetical protein